MNKYSYAYESKPGFCELVSDNYLQINNCGMLKVTEKEGVSSNRPPRVDYMLIYLFSGTASASINGIQRHMLAGDCLLLKPDNPLIFKFDCDSAHFWIHFTGNAVESLLNEVGFNETNLYNIGVFNKIWDLCTDIYINRILYDYNQTIRINCIFLKLLNEFTTHLLPSANTSNENIKTNKIYPAIKEMMLNFSQNHKLKYYADICGISLSDFQHSFTQITGTTPLKYLQNVRISTAKNLLSYPSITIKEVAVAVGYDDPLYFSRIFKKATGHSPKEYQKIIQEELS